MQHSGAADLGTTRTCRTYEYVLGPTVRGEQYTTSGRCCLLSLFAPSISIQLVALRVRSIIDQSPPLFCEYWIPPSTDDVALRETYDALSAWSLPRLTGTTVTQTMATLSMRSPTRRPFGSLDGIRLRSLTNTKNSQNSSTSLSYLLARQERIEFVG